MMNHNSLEVVFEDNHIIICYKPANILSQKDHTNDPDMTDYVKAYIKEKYKKPGNVYLGLIHRLDRRVSGLMVFAKTSKAASRLSNSFRKGLIDKYYLTIVLGRVEKNRLLEDYLIKESRGNEYNARVVSKDHKDSKIAKLEYEIIKYGKIGAMDVSLLKVGLLTGRYNQIRVQLANIGHPIINDFKYSYRGENILDELALTSYKLSFPHPVTTEVMEFVYLPKSALWEEFKEDLRL